MYAVGQSGHLSPNSKNHACILKIRVSLRYHKAQDHTRLIKSSQLVRKSVNDKAAPEITMGAHFIKQIMGMFS